MKRFLHSPANVFWLCAGIYFLAWTIVPAFSLATIPIDTLEGYAWGHEWQLGSYKHPPLAAWISEALAALTQHANWTSYLANELAVITTFWAVWQTGRRMVSETAALIGALLLTVIPYYNIIIPEFNPNVLSLPFWALIGWSFHRAVKDDKIIDWLLLGLWAAASLYTKYSSALLLASLGGLMVWHPEARRHLKSIGPWLALGVMTVLMAPHALWLIKNNFMPFTYAADRFEHLSYGRLAFIIVPALFIFWQAATVLPAAILYVFSFGKPTKAYSFPSFDKTFLYFVTFGPAVIAGAVAITTEGVIRNMWATPFWNFIGLWAVFCFQPEMSPKALRRFAGLGSALFIAYLVGFFCVEALSPYITHKPKRINLDGQYVADQISQEWHNLYHQPLRYVVGETFIGGVVAWYAPDRPHQLTDGDYKISPWIDPAELKKYGGVIVWCGLRCDKLDAPTPPAYIQSAFPQAQFQPPLVFPLPTGARVPEGMVEWAIIPPGSFEEYP
jgi:4-amino-4-deoxy-L-arabinose transferase-like glycosyltransferase